MTLEDDLRGPNKRKKKINTEKFRMPFDALRPLSAVTHFIGMALGVAALVVLVVLAAKLGTAWHVVAFSLYGASLILLYGASAFYHSLRVSPKWRARLRKLDHSMIYILIAGTYTPVCLLPIRGPWGWSLFGVIWGLAIAGIMMKQFWITAPRWISVSTYLVMGWAALVALYPIFSRMTPLEIFWLFSGGAFYTLGSVMYALKWPGKNRKWFGFHEWFHILVMAGSVCHFLMMLQFIIR